MTALDFDQIVKTGAVVATRDNMNDLAVSKFFYVKLSNVKNT